MSSDELRAAFTTATGWEITSLEPDRIDTRIHQHGASAWLAMIRRI